MHFGMCFFATSLAALWEREHPASHVLYPTPHILRPAPCIPHPMWDPVERGLGPLPISTGCTLLGKLEGSRGALVSGCPAWPAKSQQKAWSPEAREGLCGGTGHSWASSFVPALRKRSWVYGGGSIHGVHPAWPREPRTGKCLLHKPGCKQAPECVSGLSQLLASLTASKAAGNLGGKVPPWTASLFVGSWEENPSKLRRRKGVPKTELQSRKAISTQPKSLEFLSRENKKQSVNLQLKSLPKSVNNFHIQRIYFSLGFQCKVIQLRKVGPLYCCSQIHMHLFCWKFDIGHFLYSHLSLAKK